MTYLFHKVANPVGIIGVFLILIAYGLLHLNKLSQNTVSYSLLNVVGSVLILYSLYFYWNLASGIIEIAWLIISIYGLFKSLRIRKKRRENLT